MGVEEIAGEVGEVLDVFERDHPGFRVETVADLEFVEEQRERVAVVAASSTIDPLARNRSDEIGRALHRGALHVMKHRANATEFFTATRSTGPAVNKLRKR